MKKVILGVVIGVVGAGIIYLCAVGFSSSRSSVSEYPSYSNIYSPSYSSPSISSYSLNKSSDRISESVGSSSSSTSSPKKVIKGGQLSLVVKDVNEAANDAKSIAKSLGGELASSYQSNPDNPTETITVKVPVGEFETAVKKIREIAQKVSSESINLDDVTEQYEDYQARMKNLKVTEAQYQLIMNRANTVAEVLSVQEKLSQVRGEIEQLQAQITYLARQTDMSTITLYLATDEEELPILTTNNKWKPLIVFKSALRSLINFFKVLSYVIIWLAVFAVIWVPIWFLYRFIRKRRIYAKAPEDKS